MVARFRLSVRSLASSFFLASVFVSPSSQKMKDNLYLFESLAHSEDVHVVGYIIGVLDR